MDLNSLLRGSPSDDDGALREVTTLLMRAAKSRAAGDLAEALEQARRANALIPALPRSVRDDVNIQHQHLMGSIYRAMGEYHHALSCHQRAYQAVSERFGPDAPETEIITRALADIHYLLGNYDRATELCLAALRVSASDKGDAHAYGLQLLARIRSATGDTAGAAAANDAANPILGSSRSGGTVAEAALAANINNSAVYAVNQGRLAEGIRLHRRALRLRTRFLGRNSQVTAESLVGLGCAYVTAGHPRRGRRLLRRALSVYERAGEDRDRFRYASALLDYGYTDYLLGRQGADVTIGRALAQATELLGPHHPLVWEAQARLARVLAEAGDPKQAMRHLVSAGTSEIRLVGPVFGSVSAERRLVFLRGSRRRVRDPAVTLLANQLASDTDEVRNVLRLVIQRTGLTAEAISRQNAALLANRYPRLAGELNRLTELDRLLSAASLGNEAVPTMTVRSWVRERSAIEAKLAASVVEIRPSEDLVDLDLDRIADALPTGSCLLHYVRYADRGADRKRPPINRYAAFLLPAGAPAAPRFVDLGQADVIDNLIEQYQQVVAQLAASNDNQVRALRVKPAPVRLGRAEWLRQGAALSAAVLEPIGLGSDLRRLIVVPDGLLHRVPLATLPDHHEVPLVHQVVISYLGSARDLLPGSAVEPGGPPLVVANPDFGPRDPQLRRAAIHRVFRALPGTEEEGRRVGDILGVEPVTGARAKKTVLETRPAPVIAHLATHGFWYADRTGPVATAVVRSGLTFAGANAPGGEGLLSAEEISHLDLRGTRLVVLSACESGLGVIHDAEGAFGLHRAFAIAGAHVVVSSLWEVPDAATAEVMVCFYTALAGGSNPAQALAQAQASLTEKENVGAWGAFVCHGLPHPGYRQ